MIVVLDMGHPYPISTPRRKRKREDTTKLFSLFPARMERGKS
jgi:hypothetical protein